MIGVTLRPTYRRSFGEPSNLLPKFGPAKAITAAAHKMARIIYHMVTTKQAYDDSILAKQDAQQRQKREAKIRRQARELGFQLTPLKAA